MGAESDSFGAIYLNDNPPNSTNEAPQDNISMASSGN